MGTILTIIVSMVLGSFIGALGSYLGFILVTVWVGYRVNEDVANGAIHGALVALLAGIFSFISMYTVGSLFNMGPGLDLLSFGISGVIIGLLVNGLLGMVGSVIGSYISTNN
ncbi:MAG: DUF5518 domain-containing protein [Methanobacterium sp.]|nr:DUF5518 domain-containing protein [Methanobacterium sp.]